MNCYGFLKAAAASPRLKIANPAYNVSEIMHLVRKAEEKGTAVLVFPELCITGYTCGDLFMQRHLQEQCLDAVKTLLKETKDISALIMVGAPLVIKDRLYNCALAIQMGRILGVIPKMFIPNYKEFYEKRWFSSGFEISREINEIFLLGQGVPFGNLLFVSKEPGFVLGAEICEDLWTPVPPSSHLAVKGANIIVNLSASNELVAKAAYRRQLVAQQSARCSCAYIFASAGVHESTTDLVFSGDCLIGENGLILASNPRFEREGTIIYTEIDLDILKHERLLNTSFWDSADRGADLIKYTTVELLKFTENVMHYDNLSRKINKNPFIPADPRTVEERSEEIFNIQVAGLAKRMEHTGMKHAVLGISGGLDSTLALLVTRKTFDLLGLPPNNIIAVTMPGFGTTDRTYNNALRLMKELGVTTKEISIKEACLQHFADIGHDPSQHDVTYENVQARERTQVLMDLANKVNGLVIGTGDLSELGLGWATYNGDHMSMYGVNSSVPKTLVKFLVSWAAEHVMTGAAAETLYEIIDTPISPELLPPDQEGKIQQKTEDIIGPYQLHDFFLFYTLRYGMEPQKLLFLAEAAYKGEMEREEIKKWLKLFYKRFFNSQFKRSCLPDGPKVGSVSLSPRGDWRMPSDADVSAWLESID